MNNFGQLRGTYNSPNFIEQQSFNFTSDIEISSFDNTIFLNDGFSYPFNTADSYYLQFEIKSLENDAQTIYLKLIGGQEDATQLLQTYNIPPGEVGKEAKKYLFEIVFTPNGNYNTICWELLRNVIDYTDINGQRRTNIVIKKFATLNNFITSNISNLKKIGIQGPPSMLMCINGEQIRIGKSGTYEISNGIIINFISFIPKENDYYIMDYQY